MSINLLTTTEIKVDRLPRSLRTNLFSNAISVELSWYSERESFSGKVMYRPQPNKRFVAPPKQFYILDAQRPCVVMQTDGFGTIVTSPSDSLGERYSSKLFHASLSDDASALLDIGDVRKRLNLTYLFNTGDLNHESVLIGDNKKVRTFMEPMEEERATQPAFADYVALGKLVNIHRKSKNAAPSTVQVGLLTATGILYRLEVDEKDIVTGHAAIGCLDI